MTILTKMETTSGFSPKPIDISPNMYYYLGESEDVWGKGDSGLDESV